MGHEGARNHLDEALGLEEMIEPVSGRVIAIEDCVETSGAFVVHHLIKRFLSLSNNNSIIFLAFAHPFSHYDRVLRKLGCNLGVQRDNKRFLFLDMLTFQSSDKIEGKTGAEALLLALYVKLHKTISDLPPEKRSAVTIIIDDLSLMEVAANGSTDNVLNFIHYCHTLTSEFKCSLITLIHEDIYSCMETPSFKLQIEYISDVLIRAEPLPTGLASDVHGQLTILHNKISRGLQRSTRSMCNFQFRVKENNVEYFYPGSHT
ncbi:hypothetical protein ACFE04_002257 [Oxalis oulophora]